VYSKRCYSPPLASELSICADFLRLRANVCKQPSRSEGPAPDLQKPVAQVRTSSCQSAPHRWRPSACTRSSGVSERALGCLSRSIRTCCGTAAAMRSPMRATTPGACRLGSVTEYSAHRQMHRAGAGSLLRVLQRLSVAAVMADSPEKSHLIRYVRVVRVGISIS
jgi:hypothetical protein